MTIRNTRELRAFIQKTIDGLQNGTLSNSVARTQINAARAFLDTVKVDIAALQLGRDLQPAEFDILPAIEHRQSQ